MVKKYKMRIHKILAGVDDEEKPAQSDVEIYRNALISALELSAFSRISAGTEVRTKPLIKVSRHRIILDIIR